MKILEILDFFFIFGSNYHEININQFTKYKFIS